MRICACGNTIPSGMTINNKRRCFHGRTRCLDCSPFKSKREFQSKDERKISKHKTAKKWLEKYKQQNGVCLLTDRNKIRKRYIIGLIGGKCQLCGYDKCQQNLSFHHVADKEITIVRAFMRSADVAISELQKCVLCCHNCHGEIHDGMVSSDILEEAHIIVVDALSVLIGLSWDQITTHKQSQLTN